jgi:hypothetical protein
MRTRNGGAKSKKASARVTATKWTSAEGGKAKGSAETRKVGGGASGGKTGKSNRTRAQAIQGHITARGRRQQAKRDSR